jgi:hypothetical protein
MTTRDATSAHYFPRHAWNTHAGQALKEELVREAL